MRGYFPQRDLRRAVALPCSCEERGDDDCGYCDAGVLPEHHVVLDTLTPAELAFAVSHATRRAVVDLRRAAQDLGYLEDEAWLETARLACSEEVRRGEEQAMRQLQRECRALARQAARWGGGAGWRAEQQYRTAELCGYRLWRAAREARRVWSRRAA